ncbi:MAG: NAD(P)H-dependent flavin oxidoreductase [Ktedonobacteraceae bacterium]
MQGNLTVQLSSQMVLPVIAAPMFLVSGPDLVLATCKEGVIGAFPAPNARISEQLDEWMQHINDDLTAARLATPQRRIAPWAANLVTHRSYNRLQADLELVVKHKAPIVITALGSPKPVIEAVHGYGGLVFADVNSISYARKCVEVGVDGLILVCSGAGGHTGSLTAFTFIEAVREFWDGIIVLSGSIASGRAIHAAQVLGADMVYIGTRFIATRESLASEEYRKMLVEATVEDIICTKSFTGAYANMLKPSILRAGLDPDALPTKESIDFDNPHSHAQPWKDIWSAGQCVGVIKQIQSVAELVSDLRREYAQAIMNETQRYLWSRL